MNDLRWQFSTIQPADWGPALERTGGGFYHSPLGLLLSATTGTPLYCTLYNANDDVLGIALGAERRCRFSSHSRHLSFPSLPALRDLPAPEMALASLIAQLHARGAAEVSMATYDTPWTPAPDSALLTGSLRQEYLVHLNAEPDELLRSFSRSHRQDCSRGRRDGREIRLLTGTEAVETIDRVMASTADRAQSHGRSYALAIPIEAVEEGDGDTEAGKLATFAAYHDDLLLAAALVGFAGRRSYLIISGSTPEGYRKRTSAWFYWRLMAWLYERGCSTFNMGGSPGSPLTASDPDDPHYGLYNFKMSFGAEAIPSRCGYWELSQHHLRLHRITSWLNAHADNWRSGTSRHLRRQAVDAVVNHQNRYQHAKD